MKTSDMASFDCSDECEDLSNVGIKEDTFFKLSDLYPGLTNAERALVGQDPVKSLQAYRLSWKAESICNGIYGYSDHNDESDACRHYVWAAVMNHDLGKDSAAKVLGAHEQEPRQPAEEKQMDLGNNEVGISTAEKLTKDGNYSEEMVLKRFKDDLSNHKLKVIKSRFGKDQPSAK